MMPDEPPDRAERIVLVDFEQFLQHGPMGKVDKQRIFADAVLPGENCEFFEKVLGDIVWPVHGNRR